MARRQLIVIVLLLIAGCVPMVEAHLTYPSRMTSGQTTAFGSQESDPIVVEITRKGWGMITPLEQQVYFRLYQSGRAEYETPIADPQEDPPRFGFELHQIRVEPELVATLLRCVRDPEFLKVADHYDAITPPVDAAMITTVRLADLGVSRQVVIVNYRPKARGARYPAVLERALRLIVEMRPQSEDERRYGAGALY